MNEDAISKADLEIMATYRYAERRFLRFSEQASRKAGITPQWYLLMLAIEGYPGRDYASIGELAERLQLTHHSTVGLVDRAAERGLVRREHDSDDRRRVKVCLTHDGLALLSRLAIVHREELKRLRNDLRPPVFADGSAESGAKRLGACT